MRDVDRVPVISDREDLRGREHVFRDRAHAGAELAEMLAPRFDRRPGVVVMAIPAGGVPVAAPIARRLALPLDVAVVSKMTVLWNSEAGYGAVAFDGSVALNESLVERLRLSPAEVEAGVAGTRAKVARRNETLRRSSDYGAVGGAVVILIDDGLASGYTMRAAIAALGAAGAAAVTVAVPTAHESSARQIAALVDSLYCANLRGGPSYAVADAYRRWSDVEEEAARAVLEAFARERGVDETDVRRRSGRGR